MISFFKTIKRLLPASIRIWKRNIGIFYQIFFRKPSRCLPLMTLLPTPTLKPPIPKLIKSEITQLDVEENIGELLNLVKHAIDRGELDKAEAILEMGIKICEEYQSYYALPYMYDILASIALINGKIAKAEKLLVRVIEKMIQLDISENNDQMIDFKLRLARIYSLYQEDVLAEIGYSTCLREQEKKIRNGDISTKTGLLYINCLFFYGLHKISISDYVKAKNLIDSAYGYAMKIKGLSPYQEMMILGTLADLNSELKDYDIAIQNINSAIILGKGIGSIDLPKMYLKLGKIYIHLDAKLMADKWLQEAYDLAQLFNDKKVYEEAEQLMQSLGQ